ncbi:hypothetical protein ACP70R_043403 [Stipagrostis hirtigluma subsp. patula]
MANSKEGVVDGRPNGAVAARCFCLGGRSGGGPSSRRLVHAARR